MRTGWWDSFLRFDGDGGAGAGAGAGAGDGGAGGSGGGGSGNSGAGGGKDTPKDPPWKAEFGDSFDPEKAWELIQNQRRAERTLKKERDDATGKVKEYEDKDKTELEKIQTKNKELEEQVKTLLAEQTRRNVASVIETAAQAAGALYPADVFKLIDQSELEMSDDGKVKNAEKVIQNLKQARPALFGRAPSADGGAGRQGSSPEGAGVMNDLIRRAAGRA